MTGWFGKQRRKRAGRFGYFFADVAVFVFFGTGACGLVLAAGGLFFCTSFLTGFDNALGFATSAAMTTGASSCSAALGKAWADSCHIPKTVAKKAMASFLREFVFMGTAALFADRQF